jgi:hypothetical protein
MANSEKNMAGIDPSHAIRFAFNEQDKTIAVGSFVASKINHKVTKANTTSTIEQYSYYDGSTLLYIVEVEYTNSSKDDLLRVERVS